MSLYNAANISSSTNAQPHLQSEGNIITALSTTTALTFGLWHKAEWQSMFGRPMNIGENFIQVSTDGREWKGLSYNAGAYSPQVLSPNTGNMPTDHKWRCLVFAFDPSNGDMEIYEGDPGTGAVSLATDATVHNFDVTGGTSTNLLCQTWNGHEMVGKMGSLFIFNARLNDNKIDALCRGMSPLHADLQGDLIHYWTTHQQSRTANPVTTWRASRSQEPAGMGLGNLNNGALSIYSRWFMPHDDEPPVVQPSLSAAGFQVQPAEQLMVGMLEAFAGPLVRSPMLTATVGRLIS